MAAYRHFDLKKYVKIKYRASDIILAILGFVIVSVLYHLGNFFRLVATAVFAMLYAIIINRRILGKVVNRIKDNTIILDNLNLDNQRFIAGHKFISLGYCDKVRYVRG